MAVQFTIIGLGQVGASIGLALAGQGKRVGYDRALDVQKKARELGALDAAPYNLHEAVEAADVLLLCTPLSQIEKIMEQLAPDLRDGAVVMDTAPLKIPVSEWARTHLPPGRHYIGLIPALNPACLDDSLHGPDSARADLFAQAALGIAAPLGTPEAALNQATHLASLLGAQPFFLDLHEADGLLATTHILPQLSAAALLNATAGQAGWWEARRLAGRPYSLATAPLFEDGLDALLQEAQLNRENVLHALEMTIGGLAGIHAALKESNDADLRLRLERAVDDRLAWWQGRQSGNWTEQSPARNLPAEPGLMERLFGTFLAGKKKK